MPRLGFLGGFRQAGFKVVSLNPSQHRSRSVKKRESLLVSHATSRLISCSFELTTFPAPLLAGVHQDPRLARFLLLLL